jgi:hypothetical protein
MFIDMNIVNFKVQQRKNRISTYANANNVPDWKAAMFIDQNSKFTTNRTMLAEAGYPVSEVTKDNYIDVINALEAINVKILWANTYPVEHMVKNLNNIINEEINECWGGPDMQEFIDILPPKDDSFCEVN